MQRRRLIIAMTACTGWPGPARPERPAEGTICRPMHTTLSVISSISRISEAIPTTEADTKIPRQPSRPDQKASLMITTGTWNPTTAGAIFGTGATGWSNRPTARRLSVMPMTKGTAGFPIRQAQLPPRPTSTIP
jgi:hypothetical protein